MYINYEYDRTLYKNKELAFRDDERVKKNRREFFLFTVFLVNFVFPMKLDASALDGQESGLRNVGLSEMILLSEISDPGDKKYPNDKDLFFQPADIPPAIRVPYYEINWGVDKHIGMDFEPQQIVSSEAANVTNSLYLREDMYRVIEEIKHKYPYFLFKQGDLTEGIRWFEGRLRVRVYVRRVGEREFEIMAVADHQGIERVEKVLLEHYK